MAELVIDDSNKLTKRNPKFESCNGKSEFSVQKNRISQNHKLLGCINYLPALQKLGRQIASNVKHEQSSPIAQWKRAVNTVCR